MDHSNLAETHQAAKGSFYWNNLTAGTTGQYKEAVIEGLISEHLSSPIARILDIGCGTAEIAFRFRAHFGARDLVCMDYDSSVLKQLEAKFGSDGVTWLCHDVFQLKDLEKGKFDLILLLDMVHEVYSFYGRPDKKLEQPVDHSLGLNFVRELLDNVVSICSVGGGIVITDNVLCEEDHAIKVRVRNSAAIHAVRYFLSNYPTKKIEHRWDFDDQLTINSRDFCTLLTQYNKVKNENWDRWNVEKMEIHQYLTQSEYISEFSKRNFKTHIVVGTPDDAKQEWQNDFEVLEGLSSIPAKRVSLIAIREK